MRDTDKVIRIAIIAGTAMVGIIMLCSMYQSFSALMLGQMPGQTQEQTQAVSASPAAGARPPRGDLGAAGAERAAGAGGAPPPDFPYPSSDCNSNSRRYNP
ncbi:MAG: hypothetical protein ABF791_11855, partial [Acetobacter sp.]|uniref:hypothetical protein n=1 Tax=Acetobacter sp. TaxID=440 RepID=UPI0039E8AC54